VPWSLLHVGIIPAVAVAVCGAVFFKAAPTKYAELEELVGSHDEDGAYGHGEALIPDIRAVKHSEAHGEAPVRITHYGEGYMRAT